MLRSSSSHFLHSTTAPTRKTWTAKRCVADSIAEIRTKRPDASSEDNNDQLVSHQSPMSFSLTFSLSHFFNFSSFFFLCFKREKCHFV